MGSGGGLGGALCASPHSPRGQRVNNCRLKRLGLTRFAQRIDQRDAARGITVAALDMAVPHMAAGKAHRHPRNGHFPKVERCTNGPGATAHHDRADLRAAEDLVIGLAMVLGKVRPKLNHQGTGRTGENGQAALSGCCGGRNDFRRIRHLAELSIYFYNYTIIYLRHPAWRKPI